jgi:hypothetical protein
MGLLNVLVCSGQKTPGTQGFGLVPWLKVTQWSELELYPWPPDCYITLSPCHAPTTPWEIVRCYYLQANGPHSVLKLLQTQGSPKDTHTTADL